ncbi:hypothetical protein NEF87_000893 [Candidatus Lokiarchaeum ossiferum]|uniref:Uncharacterized protein n=1 Tax=Candidatus Lokiarchaeum ossiferum TaxID=2951803 RepID=A0ABY6HM78_9ARCH|nr:hypothetical protein NEF87_000893 [Candidatus Lokiarchaeum sp. B-35]
MSQKKILRLKNKHPILAFHFEYSIPKIIILSYISLIQFLDGV